LVNTDKLLRETGIGRLMVSVHDEIGVSIPKGCGQRHIDQIATAYTDFNSESSRIRMRVPITASVGIGGNWWASNE